MNLAGNRIPIWEHSFRIEWKVNDLNSSIHHHHQHASQHTWLNSCFGQQNSQSTEFHSSHLEWILIVLDMTICDMVSFIFMTFFLVRFFVDVNISHFQLIVDILSRSSVYIRNQNDEFLMWIHFPFVYCICIGLG